MGQFLIALRTGKIKTPNTRDWSEINWKHDFLKFICRDADDQIAFNAGMWFGRRLSLYWKQIHELDLSKYDRFDIFTKITLLVNHISLGKTPGNNAIANNATFSQLQTLLGDSFNRALKYLNSINEFGQESIDKETLERCFYLFNSIYFFEFMWDRALWSDRQIKEEENSVRLEPNNEFSMEMIKHEAISEFLRQSEELQMQILYEDQWKSGILDEIMPITISLKEQNCFRATFDITVAPPKDMPPYIPALLSDLPNWLSPMVSKKVAELDNEDIVEVLFIWRILYEAVKSIIESGRPEVIHVNDATNLISRVRSHLNQHTIRKIVDFLTYDSSEKKGDGIWGAPFVRLSQEILCPVIPSLMYPNVQRMVDLWGERCISAELLTFRGELWEEHVRNSLIEGFNNLKLDIDWWVYPNDLKRWGHQIDILFRVENLVVVGETKFTKYPCIPAEFGRYFQKTLDYAGSQAAARQNTLGNNKKELAKLSKFAGDPLDFVIIPLVVSPHFLGSGMVFRGVNCLSYDDLMHFFNSDALVFGDFSAEGVDAIAKLRFRMDGEKICEALLRYVKQSPQMFLYSEAVHRFVHRFEDAAPIEKMFEWVDSKVIIPHNHDEVQKFAKNAEFLWNDKVIGRLFL